MRRQRNTWQQALGAERPSPAGSGRRRLATSGAALVLLAGFAAPAPGAIAAPPTTAADGAPTAARTGNAAAGMRTITWAPCEEMPAIQCGKLTLPVDWSKPSGATFELALAKRPADEPAATR